jgi:hypothetical protein
MNLSTADLGNYWTEFHETWWSYRYIQSHKIPPHSKFWMRQQEKKGHNSWTVNVNFSIIEINLYFMVHTKSFQALTQCGGPLDTG